MSYYSIFIILSFFIFLSIHLKSKYEVLLKLYIYIFISIILILFSGLRKVGVGLDDHAYAREFIEINLKYNFYRDSSVKEPLFFYLNYIVRKISDNPNVLFIVISAISTTLYNYNWYRYSKYYYISSIIYFSHLFLHTNLTQIRIGISIGILLYSIKELYNKKYFKFIIYIIISFLFHTSSIVYILIIVFNKFKLSKYVFLKLLYISIILYFILPYIFDPYDILLSINLNNDILNFIKLKLSDYRYSYYSKNLGLLDITNIKNTFILLAAIKYYNLLNYRFKYFNILILVFSIGVFWRIIFSNYGIIAARIAILFTSTEPLIISYFYHIFKNKYLYILLIILYSFLMLYLNLNNNVVNQYNCIFL